MSSTSARQMAAVARTLLFVPGDRPERFGKAAAAGADGVVLDLEDAVAPDCKEAAQDHVRRWLLTHPKVVVRINARRTSWFDADVDLVAGTGCCVMLPKAESITDIELLCRRLPPDQGVLALIESARGVQNALQLSQARQVCRTALGTIDLAADLGVDPGTRDALLLARTQLVLAARAANLVGPIDGVTVAVADDERLADDVRYATSLGLAGKLCIHPRQVATVHAATAPGADAVSWAQRVLKTATQGGASLVDGEMVDAPVLARAQMILARATASPAPDALPT